MIFLVESLSLVDWFSLTGSQITSLFSSVQIYLTNMNWPMMMLVNLIGSISFFFFLGLAVKFCSSVSQSGLMKKRCFNQGWWFFFSVTEKNGLTHEKHLFKKMSQSFWPFQFTKEKKIHWTSTIIVSDLIWWLESCLSLSFTTVSFIPVWWWWLLLMVDFFFFTKNKNGYLSIWILDVQQQQQNLSSSPSTSSSSSFS